MLEEGGRPVEEAPLDDADAVVDALFGTGFHGEPREDAARQIAEINAAKAPVVGHLPRRSNAATEGAGATLT